MCQLPRKNLNVVAQQGARLQEVFLGSLEADQEVVDLAVVLEEVGLEELKVVDHLEERLHQEACLARWAKVVEVGLGPVYCCCLLESTHHLNSS